jgi:hypothetical protein
MKNFIIRDLHSLVFVGEFKSNHFEFFFGKKTYICSLISVTVLWVPGQRGG